MEKQLISKNIFKVIFSNLLLVGIGLVISIALPMVMSVNDYAYWQLFYMISAYLGVFTFGFLDGINLIYAQKVVKDLDGLEFGRLFKFTLKLTFLIAVISIIVVYLLNLKYEYKIIAYFLSINVILFNLNGFFIHYYQISLRFTQYSIINVLTKMLFTIFTLLALLLGYKNFELTLITFTLSNFVVLIINLVLSRNLILILKSNKSKRIFYLSILIAGLPLMMSSIVSMLFTSIPRVLIVSKYGIEEFSYFSFSITLTFLITQVVHGISTVIYPIIRKTEQSNYSHIVDDLLNILNLIVLFTLFIPLGIELFIYEYFNKYNESIKYLSWAFILVVFQAKNSLVMSVFYKALRLEKKYFLLQIVFLSICMIFGYLASLIFENSIYIVIVFVLCYALSFYVYYYYILTPLRLKTSGTHFYDLFLLSIFLLMNHLFENVYLKVLLLSFIVILTVLIFREKINRSLKLLFRK